MRHQITRIWDKETAKMAVEIIKGGDPAQDAGKDYGQTVTYIINSDTAKSLGITYSR